MNSNYALNIVIAIIVILFVYWFIVSAVNKNNKRERFTDVTKTIDNTIPIDYEQRDIEIIQPPKYDAYSDIIESGSLFIPQPEYYNTQGVKVVLGDNNDPDGPNMKGIGDTGLNFNLCSKSCCSDQWPVPFRMPVDKMTCSSTDEFVPSNLYCNNGWQDSGCLCLKKDQADFINSRGENSDLYYF